MIITEHLMYIMSDGETIPLRLDGIQCIRVALNIDNSLTVIVCVEGICDYFQEAGIDIRGINEETFNTGFLQKKLFEPCSKIIQEDFLVDQWGNNRLWFLNARKILRVEARGSDSQAVFKPEICHYDSFRLGLRDPGSVQDQFDTWLKKHKQEKAND